MTHELKTWPKYFREVYSNKKTFEVRKNDRDFKVGDTLFLKEYIPETNEYTGNWTMRKVTYILKGGDFGIEKGFVVMGIKPTSITT